MGENKIEQVDRPIAQTQQVMIARRVATQVKDHRRRRNADPSFEQGPEVAERACAMKDCDPHHLSRRTNSPRRRG